MSKSRVIVLSVVHQGLTKSEVARKFGVSWQRVHELVTRYERDGEAGLEPKSRRPHTNKNQTPPHLVERVIELRHQLTHDGFDAGPQSIRDRLLMDNLAAPTRSTISRILKKAGLIVPEPRKRPKSSYIRFEADQPNECWQSDFTHKRLADGTDVEIINWLDDHSRYLLSLHAHPRITGEIVIDTFIQNIDHYGPPASTLTDNGTVYTARFTKGRNGFEYLIAALGIRQKNGSPGHPQTQGKIQRFHQTQKKWLAAQTPATTLAELQHQLDNFQHAYNTKRPHRSLHGHTPEHAYHATLKATPHHQADTTHYRIRIDRLDPQGKASLRQAGKMHHLGARIINARKRVLMLIDDTTVTITEISTGEGLSQHLIQPERSYWPNTLKPEGRWPQQ